MFCLLLLLIICSSRTLGKKEQVSGFNHVKGYWTLIGGFGRTLRYFGEPRVKVQEAELILRYGHFLTEEVGKSWYKSRHGILIELPFSYVYDPDRAIMAGINFLACWDFVSSEKIVPYLFIGGGLVYTNLHLPGLGSKLNGNYQGGIGIHYLISRSIAFDLNCRLHHISNANLVDPNVPLNSAKLLFGLTILR